MQDTLSALRRRAARDNSPVSDRNSPRIGSVLFLRGRIFNRGWPTATFPPSSSSFALFCLFASFIKFSVVVKREQWKWEAGKEIWRSSRRARGIGKERRGRKMRGEDRVEGGNWGVDAKRRLHLIGRRWKNDAKESFCDVWWSRPAMDFTAACPCSVLLHPLGTLIELAGTTCTCS